MTTTSLWIRVTSNRRNTLLLLFALGLIVRCAFILLYPGANYYAGSSIRYARIAENLLNGHGLSVLADTSRISSSVRQFVYEPFVDKPAGYPLLLWGVFSIFGQSMIAVQVIQAILMALLAPLFYLTAERLSGNMHFASICGILAAVWPNSARFDVVVLPEPLVAFPIALVLYLMARKLDSSKDRWILGVLSGLLTGIGVLLRADVALWPAFLFAAIGLMYGMRYAVRLLIPFALGMILVVSCQTVYNYVSTSGKIIPLGYSNGIAAFEGISQFGDTLGTVYSDDRLKLLEDQSDLYYPRGPERDMARTSKAISIIKERPIWYIKTVLKRIPLLLTPRGLFVIGDDTPTKNTKEDFTQRFPGSLIHELREQPVGALTKILSAVLGLLLMLFAVLGCWRWRSYSRLWILPLSVVLYFFLAHIPLNVEPRYFYPAVPFLLPLAGTFFIRKGSLAMDPKHG